MSRTPQTDSNQDVQQVESLRIMRSETCRDKTMRKALDGNKDRMAVMRKAIDRIDRDRMNKHAHIQSSKAFIEAAQSESKNLENKKSVARVNKDRICAPGKHRNSSCLDSSFQPKILGESWQNFPRSHISAERRARNRNSQNQQSRKQTEQASVATTPKNNSSTTIKPQPNHIKKYTSSAADN